MRESWEAGDLWTKGELGRVETWRLLVTVMLSRYIYWNAHYFGENFYGWSIGDSQSLVESGPFHSQGRIGASNQPWQGSWRANVSVELVTCNPAGNRGGGGAIRSQSNLRLRV